MTNSSLYNLLNMKSKNSIFKSVFVTNERTYDGLQIVVAEPYDNTFLNAVKSVSQYDKTVDKIMKKVYEYFNGQDVWLKVYTDEHGQNEILVCDYYMKQYGLL